jgi:hypothetical protein
LHPLVVAEGGAEAGGVAAQCRDTGFGKEHAGAGFEQGVGAIADGELREAGPDFGTIERFEGDAGGVSGRAGGGEEIGGAVQADAGAGLGEVEHACGAAEIMALRLQPGPDLVGAFDQRDIFDPLPHRRPRDARAAVRGAEAVAGGLRLEADGRDAAAGEGVQRRRAGDAEADDEDLGVGHWALARMVSVPLGANIETATPVSVRVPMAIMWLSVSGAVAR